MMGYQVIPNAREMERVIQENGTVWALENEITYLEMNAPKDADLVLLRALSGLIAKLAAPLHSAYRTVPVFKSPQTAAEKRLVEITQAGLKAHLPSFLDPHYPPDI